MKCQFCDNPATVHLTDVASGQAKRELHLCDACARGHELFPAVGPAQIDLKVLLALLGESAVPAAVDPAALKCDGCGLKYGQFRADGRLGCPHEYDQFRPLLEPLLERIHRSLAHAGKVPRGRVTADLRDRLAAAVAAERYEEAAGLRDLIRQKEASDEPR